MGQGWEDTSDKSLPLWRFVYDDVQPWLEKANAAYAQVAMVRHAKQQQEGVECHTLKHECLTC